MKIDDIRQIGNDAHPTAELRIRRTSPTTCRLEQLWQGGFGTMWLPVQHVDANGDPIDLMPASGLEHGSQSAAK